MSGYLDFERTGHPAFDAVLDAIENAGSMYHHTSQWAEGGFMADENEKTQLELINEKIADLRALIASSPQADDVLKDAWISVEDRLPEVPKGEYRHFTVAILRKHDNKTYSMPAVYLNEMELTNAHTYDDEIYTGWHEAKEHYEFEEYYSKIEYEGGDKVTHWQPLPAPPLDKAME